jgi:choline dehydrogenase-like flavoprotein
MWKATKQLVRGYTGTDRPAPSLDDEALDRPRPGARHPAEQAPNPDSRVMLTGEKDELGMPRVALDWRLSAIDVDSVAGLVSALDRESRRLELGMSRPAGWLAEPDKRWVSDELVSAHPIGGFHHMGTTRMSADPRRGVTDGWGRVHGFPNLHVAGSSLFPDRGLGQSDADYSRTGMRTADRISSELLPRGRGWWRGIPERTSAELG